MPRELPSGAQRSEPSGSPLLQDAKSVYPRRSLEFDRFAFFSDAVYAIALTLLVIGIAVPTITDVSSSGEMWDALVDLHHEVVSFFIGFAVVGRYWLAHHRLVAVLAAVDSRLLLVNLAYLAFVAFLPFPTALVGRYEENIVAFTFYAVMLAIISGFETVLFLVALRRGLLAVVLPEPVVRHGIVASTLPVAVFLFSIPLALIAGSTVALLSWLLIWPLEALLDRRWPEAAAKLPAG